MLVKTDGPGVYRLDLASEDFAPYVTVYELGRKQPIASEASARNWTRTASFRVQEDKTYVVVVHSADGGAGWYALNLSR